MKSLIFCLISAVLLTGCLYEESSKEYMQTSPVGDWVGYAVYPFQRDGLLNLKKGILLKFFPASKPSDTGYRWVGLRSSRFDDVEGQLKEEAIEQRDFFFLYDYKNKMIDKKVRLTSGGNQEALKSDDFQLVEDKFLEVDQVNLMGVIEMLTEELIKASENYLKIKKMVEDNAEKEEIIDKWVRGVPEIGYEYLMTLWRDQQVKVKDKVLNNCTKFLASARVSVNGEPDVNAEGITWIYCADPFSVFKIVEINKLAKVSLLKYESLASSLLFKVQMFIRSNNGVSVK